eukprot:TRINITY_DN26278_c0_g1_i1.p1 TRINITY_DN26278_c0_g1~~TRINITY_DN26278_c0_g1_i1.p1  ORF type:complete len:238 (-),score=16.96 TRINITY_DN26278_c0_g1_i1:36-749(-)
MMLAGSSVVFGAGLLYTAYVPPHPLIDMLSAFSKDKVLFRNKACQRNMISLTIDDAPTVDTRRIAELLRKYEAKATFFVIGSFVERCDPQRELLEELVREGHELGNHGYEDVAAVRLDAPTLREHIQKTEALLSFPGSSRTRWFRPGSGFYHEGMVDSVQGMGYSVALGSVYPHDPVVRSAWVNSNYLLWKTSPGDILILHDRPWTIATLEIVLPELKSRGFQIVTLSELMDYGHRL